jgi:acetyl esterase/lipase
MTIAYALLAFGGLVACFPVFRPPFSGFSFSIGFLTGELAGQLLVVTVAAGAALAIVGWPTGLLGLVADALFLGAAASYGALLGVALRARSAVARCLARTNGIDGLSSSASPSAWLAWWRTCLAVAFSRGAVTVHRDLAYGEGTAHRLDVYAPRGGTTGAPVLLFVHGGAWVFGSKRGQGLPMLHELAARGWVCVTCDYRLSPRATWPDHIVDVKRALAWTRAHASEFGGDPQRFLAIAGSSAGGHLAALAALSWDDPQWQPGFEAADTRVDACVALYGVLEMTGDPELTGPQGRATVALLQSTVMKASLADARELYEAASPLHRLRADAPPFLVLHGTKDSLVPVAVARAFVRAFEQTATAPIAYVELPWAQHAFDLICSPRCTATTRGIAVFLDAVVAARDEIRSRRPADPPPAPR